MIIDGRHVGNVIRERVKKETSELFEQTGKKPNLTVVIVGDDPASHTYVNGKNKAAKSIGFDSETIQLPIDTTQDELLALLDKLNQDDTVNGVLVQLPLPEHIDAQKIVSSVAVEKDVDGFHPRQVGALNLGLDSLLPCTPAGVIELLNYYNIPIEGQNVVVVGASNIVGRPISQLLLNLEATVTTTHIKTKNLAEFTKRADILVIAIGNPKFLKADMVKDGAVVIDVGINRLENGKIVGDVDFDEVSKKASAITPVPGGVGPMTITMLLVNTLEAYKNQLGLSKNKGE